MMCNYLTDFVVKVNVFHNPVLTVHNVVVPGLYGIWHVISWGKDKELGT